MHSLLSKMKPDAKDEKLTLVLKKCLHHYTNAYMEKYIDINEDWYCAASFLDLRFKMFLKHAPNVRTICLEKAKKKLEELVLAGPPNIKKNGRGRNTKHPVYNSNYFKYLSTQF
jgi:hypothetical protein